MIGYTLGQLIKARTRPSGDGRENMGKYRIDPKDFEDDPPPPVRTEPIVIWTKVKLERHSPVKVPQHLKCVSCSRPKIGKRLCAYHMEKDRMRYWKGKKKVKPLSMRQA